MPGRRDCGNIDNPGGNILIDQACGLGVRLQFRHLRTLKEGMKEKRLGNCQVQPEEVRILRLVAVRRHPGGHRDRPGREGRPAPGAHAVDPVGESHRQHGPGCAAPVPRHQEGGLHLRRRPVQDAVCRAPVADLALAVRHDPTSATASACGSTRCASTQGVRPRTTRRRKTSRS